MCCRKQELPTTYIMHILLKGWTRGCVWTQDVTTFALSSAMDLQRQCKTREGDSKLRRKRRSWEWDRSFAMPHPAAMVRNECFGTMSLLFGCMSSSKTCREPPHFLLQTVHLLLLLLLCLLPFPSSPHKPGDNMKCWTARLDFLAAISVKILRCFYNNNTIPANQKNSIIVLKTKENQKYENSWWCHNELQEVDVEAKKLTLRKLQKCTLSRADNLVVDKEQLLFPQ